MRDAQIVNDRSFVEEMVVILEGVRGADDRKLDTLESTSMVFQRAPLSENSAWNLPLIIVSLSILLLTVLLWPVAALVRKHYGQKLVLTPQQQRLRLLVRIVCLLDLIFFAALATFFTLAFKDIGLLSPQYNIWLRLIQIVGWLGVVGTILVVLSAVRSWRQPDRWLWSRIGDTLIAVACLGVVWFAFTWNMLHWTLVY